MKLLSTKIKGPKLIKSKIFKDNRGYLRETFRKNLIQNQDFPFDVMSFSKKNVLRGLHIQTKYSQAKIITVTHGKIFDVIVDLRKSSRSFGLSFSITLENPETIMWVPPGFAHGFYTLTDTAEVQYKTTDYYHPQSQRTLLWNELDIIWPNVDCEDIDQPLLSEKDAQGKTFEECEKYE